MTSDQHSRVTADEAATEQTYSEELRKRARALQGALRQATPNTWNATGPATVETRGELIGRVALRQPNTDHLDGERDFYIGTTHHNGSGFQVFSWAAPVACTFFRRSHDHHPLCDEVTGLRLLAHRAGVIADYEDVYLDEPREDLFPQRALEIPELPEDPVPSQSGPALETVAGRSETLEAPSDDPAPKNPDPAPTNLSQNPIEKADAGIRAPGLLRRELAKPKTVSMSTVLSTLQPDQFDIISQPASESQFLQGHPGTGKTIIAVHRVAYLLNAEAPSDHRPTRGHRVLLLGPTEEYVQHVRQALAKLIDDPTSYEVQSISSLLDDLADLPRSTAPTESVILENVSQELARLVDEALRITKENLGSGESPRPEDVYQQLIWFVHEPPDSGLQKEWFFYLKSLPDSLEELRKKQSRPHRGLLAYLKVRTEFPPDPGHVIVDEAQDIHPIEWEILGRIGNLGGWTILGDLNQRRTDHTFSSWDDVARLLAIENEEDAAPVRILDNGYRSTSQIIKFANQLLPARERSLHSLQQDGEEPEIQRVPSSKELMREARDRAVGLIGKVQGGTVGVITVDPDPIIGLLRKDGWTARRNDPSVWESGEAALRILLPQRARGLEFDGVVVVEPAQFPENFGRQGVLYTALTRANRFLTVVHHRALPRDLKKKN